MTSLRDTLLAILDSVGEDWTPDERTFVETVAQDYINLLAKRVGGADVTSELAQVRAQASSIAAGAAGSVAEAIEDGVKRFLEELISELVPGL